MNDKKNSAWVGSLISRRKVLHYGLAGMAGIVGGGWPLSAFGESNVMRGTKTGGRSAEEALNSLIIVEQLDLRAEVSKGTSSFTQEEVQQVKEVTLGQLKKEGLDKYEPSLLLIDNQNEERMIAVLVGVFDERLTESGDMVRRTYYFQDGKLIQVVKNSPKK